MKKRRLEFPWMGCLIALMIITISVPAWAKKPINTTWRGIALKGYDTVAYFTKGKAVKGKKTFEYHWKDAKWHFANQQHKKMFKADPEKYAPRYGGY
jgi:YHS domain-containing protein